MEGFFPAEKAIRKISNVIRRHGGKHFLADGIVALMPNRCVNSAKPDDNDSGWLHYVEPYFGGGNVLLSVNPIGISEVVNDIDGWLTAFWKVLASPLLYEALIRRLQGTPFSQEVALKAIELVRYENPDKFDPVYKAATFFIAARQSRQGLIKDFATVAAGRTRLGMHEQVSAWLSAIDGLADVHARMKRVVVLNDDAIKVIKQQDGKRTLFYCDPPYLHETRVTTDDYVHEMTPEQHQVLLKTLAGIEGRFLLSGYHSDMYADFAKTHQWKLREFRIANNASGKSKKDLKTESVWMNF